MQNLILLRTHSPLAHQRKREIKLCIGEGQGSVRPSEHSERSMCPGRTRGAAEKLEVVLEQDHNSPQALGAVKAIECH